MFERQYLDDCLLRFTALKSQAEKALAQATDEQIFALLDEDANSIALIVKHMSGNMRSRWTDFLTTDGEKPDRYRDTEFELDESDSREALMAAWEDGWRRTFAAVSSLKPEDLGRTILIRGERHSVIEAINRQIVHYGQHVGQIVLLAKHYAGPGWRTLSIPKRKK